MAGQRTPRGTLSRDKIVAAAVEVLGRDGLDGVTMRSVANVLDVNAMSLYRHFHAKEDLLLALVDELMAGLPLPPPGTPPVEAVREIVRAHFALLLRYPGLHLVDTGNMPAPGQLRVSERLYAALLESGMDIPGAVGLLAVIQRFVVGCAFRYPARHDWDHNLVYWNEVRASLAKLPADDYPTLRKLGAGLDDAMRTQEEIFEEGLDALLAPLSVRTRRR
ncbi:TetR/AcrR family transcriptional regulator [Amycolatopsis sp. NPDC059027]|uniref:TetR/AcrR family transcriptional regulator n=1 Tax=Amycolatopsis sp. NPDC059027 TaxID=3346709 RepID=UPI00366E14C1